MSGLRGQGLSSEQHWGWSPTPLQLCCAAHGPCGTLSLTSSPPLRRWSPVPHVSLAFSSPSLSPGISGVGGGGVSLLIRDYRLPSASVPMGAGERERRLMSIPGLDSEEELSLWRLEGRRGRGQACCCSLFPPLLPPTFSSSGTSVSRSET